MSTRTMLITAAIALVAVAVASRIGPLRTIVLGGSVVGTTSGGTSIAL